MISEEWVKTKTFGFGFVGLFLKSPSVPAFPFGRRGIVFMFKPD